ncbi:MAG: peptidase and matrixin and adamalysin [Frankiales bacterium]|jgi:hypothetical protein|nr:peptidase and matrixin and adamalysin [Frankiales bacterium]
MSLRSRVLRTLAVATTAAAVLAPVPASAMAAPAAAGAVETRHVSGGHAVTAGATITTATGASYAFSAVVGGKPVRWNPCAAIHWRANVMRAPLGGLGALKSAVASVAAATGTTWVFDGTTTAAPSSSWLPTTSTQKPVLIGWTDGTSSDLLRGKPSSVLGMTRTTWFGRSTATGTVAATRGAVVALDRTDRLPLRGGNSWTAVALHELGHAAGLAHPHDSGELMNAVLPASLTGLQAGDRSGLYRLGRSQGCISF